MAAETCAEGEAIEGVDTGGGEKPKAVPVADSPSPETLDGLSTVLGGCSGGTFASTHLTIADFSPMSRGIEPPLTTAGVPILASWPERRYARRQPALSLPVWEMARKLPGE
jgi:hypothetical protein